MHAACERARQWVSDEVDGELSSFEHVLLKAHLDACSSCSEFRADVGRMTSALRAAPLEQLEHAIEIGRVRRRLRLRLAPAAAAMAVAVVGLGSLLASSNLRVGSVGSGGVRLEGSSIAAVDTIDLRTARALARQTAKSARSTSRAPRLGGPVVHKR